MTTKAEPEHMGKLASLGCYERRAFDDMTDSAEALSKLIKGGL